MRHVELLPNQLLQSTSRAVSPQLQASPNGLISNGLADATSRTLSQTSPSIAPLDQVPALSDQVPAPFWVVQAL